VLLDFLFSKSHFDQFGRNSTDISHIIAAKIRFLIEATKKIAENLQAFSKLRNTIAELALSKAVSSLTTIVLARLLHAVPSRITTWRGL